MFSAPRPVIWTIVADVAETLAALRGAVEAAGFRIVSLAADAVVIEVPRSLRRRRPAVRLTGTVAADKDVTDITWAEEPAGRGAGNLAAVQDHIPEGILHDHGVRRASAQAGLPPLAAAEVRALSAVFQGRETVRAIGVGQTGSAPGIAALTDRRLVFAGHSTARPIAFLSFAMDSLRGLTLGKRTSGETLTVAFDGGSTIITHLGHGEGHSIARILRASCESLRPPTGEVPAGMTGPSE
ncbi:hypothetical protein [Arthrobacter sp. CG_A4]|uniref:hypothetical protein n=1 Tax=Arthrobacter sp. CG_A4 TaxID=3071706 RepID=UPI002E05AF17|nr:hypothetical protein [Arthrobacter sp. CG_A4]